MYVGLKTYRSLKVKISSIPDPSKKQNVYAVGEATACREINYSKYC